MHRRPIIAETWKVARVGGHPALVAEDGGCVLDPSDPETLVRTLFRLAQVPRMESLILRLSARLLNHEKAQPAYAERDMRLIREADATLALTRPGTAEVQRILSEPTDPEAA